MFLYIYYAKGKGVHGSKDDVALVWAWTKKQAIKRLSKYLDIRNLEKKDLNRVIRWRRRYDKKVRWISDY